MQLPKLKKRISDFVLSEEGKISKHSLVAMGAFLGSAAMGTLVADEVKGQVGPPHPADNITCPGNNDTDWVMNCEGVPGEACPIDKEAALSQKAYNEAGEQQFYGNGDCNDDDKPFHFNGAEFAYTGSSLELAHSHHGSHNSY